MAKYTSIQSLTQCYTVYIGFDEHPLLYKTVNVCPGDSVGVQVNDDSLNIFYVGEDGQTYYSPGFHITQRLTRVEMFNLNTGVRREGGDVTVIADNETGVITLYQSSAATLDGAVFTALRADTCFVVTLQSIQRFVGCPQNSGQDLAITVGPRTTLTVSTADGASSTAPFSVKTNTNAPMQFDLKNASGAVVNALVITPNVAAGILSLTLKGSGGGGDGFKFTTLSSNACLVVGIDQSSPVSVGCAGDPSTPAVAVGPTSLVTVTDPSTSASTEPFRISTTTDSVTHMPLLTKDGGTPGTLLVTASIANASLLLNYVSSGGGFKFTTLSSNACLVVGIDQSSPVSVGCAGYPSTLDVAVGPTSLVTVTDPSTSASTAPFRISTTTDSVMQMPLLTKDGGTAGTLHVTASIAKASLLLNYVSSGGGGGGGDVFQFTSLRSEACLNVSIGDASSSLGCAGDPSTKTVAIGSTTLLTVTDPSTAARSTPFRISTTVDSTTQIPLLTTDGVTAGTLTATADIAQASVILNFVATGGGDGPGPAKPKHKPSVGVYIGIALGVLAVLVIIIVPTVIMVRKRKRVSA